MLESWSYSRRSRVIFFISRYFQRFLGYRWWHCHRVSAIRLGSRAHWWNQCKDRKNIKESRRAGAICRWSLYLIIDIRERLWQRSDRGNDGENECEYRRENKKPTFYLCWRYLWNGGLLESEPRSLKTNSKCPAVQRLYADGTRRNRQQISAYLWNELPHGVLDMFVDCFSSLPKEIRAKWNGGLCSLLLDYIQNEQVKRLNFDCSMQDINRFKNQDIELDIACFLRDKSSGLSKIQWPEYNDPQNWVM